MVRDNIKSSFFLDNYNILNSSLGGIKDGNNNEKKTKSKKLVQFYLLIGKSLRYRD